MAQTPGQDPGTPSGATANVSAHGVKVLGFLVAGGALVALADVAPDAAIGLAAVLGLGVLLGHAQEFNALATAFGQAAGAGSSGGGG